MIELPFGELESTIKILKLDLDELELTNQAEECKRSSKIHRFSPQSAHFFSYSVLPVID